MDDERAPAGPVPHPPRDCSASGWRIVGRRAALALGLIGVAGGLTSEHRGIHPRPGTVDASPAGVVISAVFADGYAPGDADEALQVWNTGAAPVDVSGWSLGDATGAAAFPAGTALAAGTYGWAARDAAAFAASFGHAPDWAWSGAAGGTVRLATTGGGPRLANGGDDVVLRDGTGRTVDRVVYGASASPDEAPGGWSGPSARVYAPPGIGAAHQVLYRKLDPATGVPVADTGTARDWASDAGDAARGRRVRFPGWDLEESLWPPRASAEATIEVAVAPDALFAFLDRHIRSARRSLDVLAYTFEHAALGEAVAERARAGVAVRVLVEGRPAGGLDVNQRWVLARIAAAGGAVYWMDAGGDVGPRYRGMHAKVVVVDRAWVLVGSENPNPGAAPDDDRSDGTLGRRGVYVATDAPPVVAWATDMVARDVDPARHVDLRPFQARDPERGAPAPDVEPDRSSGGAGYRPIAPEPLVVHGEAEFELVTAPENAVDPDAGLLGLVGRAGSGDEVLVEQLDEPAWWGEGPGEGPVAVNPRVAAYLAAARRGARVRVLLDGFFDDPASWNSNAATAALLDAAAATERLDLEARLGNPTGLGLHNKLVLVRRRGEDGAARHTAHVGSLNGTEVASRANREAALQVTSEAVVRYLADVFAWDWAKSGAHAVWLPAVGR